MQEGPAGAPGLVDNLLCQDLIVLRIISVLVRNDLYGPLPAMPYPYDLIPFPYGTYGDGPDCRIKPRNIPSASQYPDNTLFCIDLRYFMTSFYIRYFLLISVSAGQLRKFCTNRNLRDRIIFADVPHLYAV